MLDVQVARALVRRRGVRLRGLFSFSDWSRDHQEFLTRWTDLREGVDAVDYMQNQKEKMAALSRLEQKCTRLCGAEPKLDQSIVKRHEDEEAASRRES